MDELELLRREVNRSRTPLHMDGHLQTPNFRCQRAGARRRGVCRSCWRRSGRRDPRSSFTTLLTSFSSWPRRCRRRGAALVSEKLMDRKFNLLHHDGPLKPVSSNLDRGLHRCRGRETCWSCGSWTNSLPGDIATSCCVFCSGSPSQHRLHAACRCRRRGMCRSCWTWIGRRRRWRTAWRTTTATCPAPPRWVSAKLSQSCIV